MAGAKVPAPGDPLLTNTDWTNILARLERTYKGYDGVSLTEWATGNTDRPEIAAGSVIEIDGSPFYYPTDETIVDGAGLTDGWCYVKHVVSGDTVTATLTNTFGTWDTAKQGFYDGSDNRFSLFAMYRSGAITKIFTQKGYFINPYYLPSILAEPGGGITQKWGYDGLLKKIPILTGGTILIRDDTTDSYLVPDSTYTTIKTLNIPEYFPKSTLAFSFEGKEGTARTTTFRVLLNGVSVYSGTVAGTDYKTFNVSALSLKGGDTLKFQGYVSIPGSSSTMYVKNARIYYDNSFTPTDWEKMIFGITL